jgi:molybdenum cofactor biosynthesis protein B
MSQAVAEHRADAPGSLNLAVLTVSDSRTIETDASGALIVALAEAAGHRVVDRAIVPDEPDRMRPWLERHAASSEVHARSWSPGARASVPAIAPMRRFPRC